MTLPPTPASSQGSSATILPTRSVTSSKNYASVCEEPERGRSLSRSSSGSSRSSHVLVLPSPSSIDSDGYAESQNLRYAYGFPAWAQPSIVRVPSATAANPNEARPSAASATSSGIISDFSALFPEAKKIPPVPTEKRREFGYPTWAQPSLVRVPSVATASPNETRPSANSSARLSNSAAKSSVLPADTKVEEKVEQPNASWWGQWMPPQAPTTVGAPDMGLFGPRSPAADYQDFQSCITPSPFPSRPLSRVTERTESPPTITIVSPGPSTIIASSSSVPIMVHSESRSRSRSSSSSSRSSRSYRRMTPVIIQGRSRSSSPRSRRSSRSRSRSRRSTPPPIVLPPQAPVLVQSGGPFSGGPQIIRRPRSRSFSPTYRPRSRSHSPRVHERYSYPEHRSHSPRRQTPLIIPAGRGPQIIPTPTVHYRRRSRSPTWSAPGVLQPNQTDLEGQPIPPLEKDRFETVYKNFCTQRNLVHSPRLMTLEARPVNLYDLHTQVMFEGGATKVASKDLWPVIGARMGFVQFPPFRTEPAKSGPGVAQHLAHVYKEYLAAFDNVYVSAMKSMRQAYDAPTRQTPIVVANTHQECPALYRSRSRSPRHMPPIIIQSRSRSPVRRRSRSRSRSPYRNTRYRSRSRSHSPPRPTYRRDRSPRRSHSRSRVHRGYSPIRHYNRRAHYSRSRSPPAVRNYNRHTHYSRSRSPHGFSCYPPPRSSRRSRSRSRSRSSTRTPAIPQRARSHRSHSPIILSETPRLPAPEQNPGRSEFREPELVPEDEMPPSIVQQPPQQPGAGSWDAWGSAVPQTEGLQHSATGVQYTQAASQTQARGRQPSPSPSTLTSTSSQSYIPPVIIPSNVPPPGPAQVWPWGQPWGVNNQSQNYNPGPVFVPSPPSPWIPPTGAWANYQSVPGGAPGHASFPGQGPSPYDNLFAAPQDAYGPPPCANIPSWANVPAQLPPWANTPVQPTLPAHPKHPRFFFMDGNVTVVVEKTLYKLHQYLFTKTDWYFEINGAPTYLFENKKDFDRFLSVLYPSDYSKHECETAEEWTSVLSIADHARMPDIRRLAIKHLAECAGPVDKIVLGHRYDVKEWLAPAYLALAMRSESITAAEGARLGVDALVRLAALQDEIYGNLKTYINPEKFAEMFASKLTI